MLSDMKYLMKVNVEQLFYKSRLLFTFWCCACTIVGHHNNKKDACWNSSRRTLRKKCQYLELFWSVFSGIWTEYGETRSMSPYSVQTRKNTGQNNSEYRHFSRSALFDHMTIYYKIRNKRNNCSEYIFP